jgi:hypothetical protein
VLSTPALKQIFPAKAPRRKEFKLGSFYFFTIIYLFSFLAAENKEIRRVGFYPTVFQYRINGGVEPHPTRFLVKKIATKMHKMLKKYFVFYGLFRGQY